MLWLASSRGRSILCDIQQAGECCSCSVPTKIYVVVEISSSRAEQHIGVRNDGIGWDGMDGLQFGGI